MLSGHNRVLRSGPHRCTSPDSPPRFPAPGKTRPDRHSGRLPRPLTPPRTRCSEQREVRPPPPERHASFSAPDPPDRRLRTDRARRHHRCALCRPPPGRTEQRRRRLSVRPAPRVLPCSVSRPLNPSVRRCSPVRPSGHRGRRSPRSGPPRFFSQGFADFRRGIRAAARFHLSAMWHFYCRKPQISCGKPALQPDQGTESQKLQRILQFSAFRRQPGARS